jgi:hypothetical protein
LVENEPDKVDGLREWREQLSPAARFEEEQREERDAITRSLISRDYRDEPVRRSRIRPNKE